MGVGEEKFTLPRFYFSLFHHPTCSQSPSPHHHHDHPTPSITTHYHLRLARCIPHAGCLFFLRFVGRAQRSSQSALTACVGHERTKVTANDEKTKECLEEKKYDSSSTSTNNKNDDNQHHHRRSAPHLTATTTTTTTTATITTTTITLQRQGRRALSCALFPALPFPVQAP